MGFLILSFIFQQAVGNLISIIGKVSKCGTKAHKGFGTKAQIWQAVISATFYWPKQTQDQTRGQGWEIILRLLVEERAKSQCKGSELLGGEKYWGYYSHQTPQSFSEMIKATISNCNHDWGHGTVDFFFEIIISNRRLHCNHHTYFLNFRIT